MVTRAELVSIARKQKLPLGMIEKDFVLTLILREIYNSRFRSTLVFKGGTALHKLYLHKRLSVDLDFTALDEFDIDIFKNILLIKEINSEINNRFKINNLFKLNFLHIQGNRGRTHFLSWTA